MFSSSGPLNASLNYSFTPSLNYYHYARSLNGLFKRFRIFNNLRMLELGSFGLRSKTGS